MRSRFLILKTESMATLSCGLYLRCAFHVDKLARQTIRACKSCPKSVSADLIRAASRTGGIGVPAADGETATVLWRFEGGREIGSARCRCASAQAGRSLAPRPEGRQCCDRQRPKPGSGHQQEVSKCLCDICTQWCASPTSSRAWTSIATSSACRRFVASRARRAATRCIFLAAPERQGARRHRACAAAGAHLQLGPGEIRRGPQFRPSGLRGRRHLRHVRPADEAGVTINRPPRDGRMAFIRSPDNVSIELLQKGRARSPRKSRGRRCPTPASGDAVSPHPTASRRNLLKICPAGDRVLKPRRLNVRVLRMCAGALGRACARGAIESAGRSGAPTTTQVWRRVRCRRALGSRSRPAVGGNASMQARAGLDLR